MGVFWGTITVMVLTQLFPSVTVSVYEPALRLELSKVVVWLFQLIVSAGFGAVIPVIDPHVPIQSTGVIIIFVVSIVGPPVEDMINGPMFSTQPAASVTVKE